MRILLAFVALTSGLRVATAQEYPVTAHIVLLGAEKHDKRDLLSQFVVWLARDVGTPRSAHASETPPRLVQKDKAFHPHVLVVPVGAAVEFPNRDPWFHNVFSLFEGKRFDLGLYEAGTSRAVHFDRPGISYIFCNIHPQMSAVVVTLNTPYWAFSDRNGHVTIANVPVGRYALHLWGEVAAPEFVASPPREITVSAESHTIGDLPVPAGPNQLANHKNKYGQDYEEASPNSPVYPQP
jgi:plastocyanin